MFKKIILSLIILSFGFGGNIFANNECKFKYMSSSEFLSINNQEDYINKFNEEYIRNQKEYKEKIYIEKKDGKYFVVNNGKKSEGYEYIVKLMISFDGKNVAYIVRENGGEYVIYNGKKSNKYLKISLQHLKFSLNGDFVFIGIKNNGETILVKNLTEIDKYSFSPSFSYNSKQFGYIKKENGKQFAIVNGNKSESFYKVRVQAVLKDKIIYEIRDDKVINKKYFYLNCMNVINNDKIQEKLDIYKSKLSTKIVLKLENIITKLSKEKLVKVYKKIDKIDLNNKKFTKYRNILNYIKLRIGLEIIK